MLEDHGEIWTLQGDLLCTIGADSFTELSVGVLKFPKPSAGEKCGHSKSRKSQVLSWIPVSNSRAGVIQFLSPSISLLKEKDNPDG